MSLKIPVKISEVTNLSDARYCAGMGVELIGFSLNENHPKFIDLSRAKEIATWISGVKMVAEFHGNNYENMNYLAETLGADYIQMDAPLDLARIDAIKKPLIVKLNYADDKENEVENLLNLYQGQASIFLLESENPPSLKKNAAILKKWCEKYPIIIGFSVETDTLAYIQNEIKPWGIALKGGEEIKPGLKNFDELSEILEALEED